MSNFKIIVFDLDGTLAPSKSKVERSMVELLERLIEERGYKVAVISGAGYKQFYDQLLQYFVKDEEILKNVFILPTNGATFCNYINGWNCDSAYTFTEEEKATVFDALEKMRTYFPFLHDAETFGEQVDDRGAQISFSALGQEAPFDLKKDWDPDHAKRKEMVNFLTPLLKDFSVKLGGSTTVDITRNGIDKAYGLKNLLERLKYSNTDLMYIGDELGSLGNDASVIGVAGKCVSVKDVKETRKIVEGLL